MRGLFYITAKNISLFWLACQDLNHGGLMTKEELLAYNQYITKQELLKMLPMPEKTLEVYLYRKYDPIPRCKIGKRNYFPLEPVKHWIENHRIEN